MLTLIGSMTRKAADVTHKLALRTLAQAISPQFDATYRHGMAWTVKTSQTPTGAGDYFLHITNNDDLRDLVITRISLDIGTADVVQAEHVTGTPGGSLTALTAYSRYVGSVPPLNATIYGSADITGLTSTAVLERQKLGTTYTHYIELIERPIILPARRPGVSLALLAATGTVAIDVAVDLMTQTVDPQEFNM